MGDEKPKQLVNTSIVPGLVHGPAWKAPGRADHGASVSR